MRKSAGVLAVLLLVLPVRAGGERDVGIADVARTAARIRDRLAGNTVIDDDLRAFLAREDAAALLYDRLVLPAPRRGRAPRTAGEALLRSTELGRVLVARPGGGIGINRHCYAELDALLVSLAGAAPPEPAEPADAPRAVLDLAALDYDSLKLDLLRSSAFYNPRTPWGARLWFTEFEDHHAARLFGLFSWPAQTTKSLPEFLDRVRSRARRLPVFTRSLDKLVVIIENVPPWLSSTDDAGTFEGGARPNSCAHPPHDPEVWATMVRETAKALSGLEGVERYYEFWNEPDGMYWQAGLDEFLDLYAVTARAVREGDPGGRVGGVAVNQWDGRLKKEPGDRPLTLEFIRRCTERKLPLDFVSWHHFGRPVSAIAEAKAACEAELRACGVKDLPEFLVTEWSVAGRGMPQATAAFAETMLALFAAKVDAQTIACFEEFHERPDAKGFAPWGMVTQQGHRKNTFFAHRFFDRLARGSTGVAVTRREGGPTIVVSRKPDGVFDLLVWSTGVSDRFRAALGALKERGLGKDDLMPFRVLDRLERAIAAGEVTGGLSKEAVAAAREAWLSKPAPWLVLELPGAERVEVLAAESVRMEHVPHRSIRVSGNRLSAPLEPYDLLRITLRVSTALDWRPMEVHDPGPRLLAGAPDGELVRDVLGLLERRLDWYRPVAEGGTRLRGAPEGWTLATDEAGATGFLLWIAEWRRKQGVGDERLEAMRAEIAREDRPREIRLCLRLALGAAGGGAREAEAAFREVLGRDPPPAPLLAIALEGLARDCPVALVPDVLDLAEHPYRVSVSVPNPPVSVTRSVDRWPIRAGVVKCLTGLGIPARLGEGDAADGKPSRVEIDDASLAAFLEARLLVEEPEAFEAAARAAASIDRPAVSAMLDGLVDRLPPERTRRLAEIRKESGN